MRINVYGLGYVGSVSAACFAAAGHDVLGVDVDSTKVDGINQRRSPVVEPGIEEVIAKTVGSGSLRATTRDERHADLSLVCVGTPSNENGSLCLDFVRRAATEIGSRLANSPGYEVVCIRSTVLPGTVQEIVLPLLEQHSGRTAGRDFGVCMNPEFLREGSSLKDFYCPPFSIVGQLDERSGNVVSELYSELSAPLIRTDIPNAEAIKYVCNVFHALKITFANEVGNICKRLGLDGREVMRIVCQDDKLNISPVYLQPGFAFGGSCLPKDVRAILHRASEVDVDVPVLRSILPSNKYQVEQAFRLIKKTGKKKVALLGLSFKPGTDDLRESPIAELAEMLIGKGFDLAIYDREVSLARIHGSNKAYIEHAIPHISSLMKETIDSTLADAEVVVIAKGSAEFEEGLKTGGRGRQVIDLVGHFKQLENTQADYEGICW